MKKTRIAFILLQDRLSYGKRDYEILKKYFDMKKYLCKFRPRYYWDAFNIFLLTLRSDVVITWGAGRQAYYVVKWAKLLGKKSIVSVMGEEVDDTVEPHSQQRIAELKRILSTADVVLVPSVHLKNMAARFSDKNNIVVIYHGFPNYFKPGGNKERLVITQSTISKAYIKRKMLDTFVKASTYLPDVQFVIVGLIQDRDALHMLKKIAGDNVKFTGYVSTEQMRSYMQRAKVYAQLSATEGFGWSLAEAMLCECVPVVTERGAIPEVVGDTGYYVPLGDGKATADAIKIALDDNVRGEAARERIKRLFPLKKREEELVKLIESLAEK